MARSPSTRAGPKSSQTRPPAAMILASSCGASGRWSTVSFTSPPGSKLGTPLPGPQTISPRESPRLASSTLQPPPSSGQTMAATQVLPDLWDTALLPSWASSARNARWTAARRSLGWRQHAVPSTSASSSAFNFRGRSFEARIATAGPPCPSRTAKSPAGHSGIGHQSESRRCWSSLLSRSPFAVQAPACSHALFRCSGALTSSSANSSEVAGAICR
mmetsp:Transcript_109491/g.327343  ORF Transcript_109491/g.327343 Transcript_109491/m.327343 type:complete len:217 (+) Transcript_109491:483-1133(+)